MSEVLQPVLALSIWNIAANDQANRIGGIAKHLANQEQQEPGITILTELVAVHGLKKALTRELGNSYSLDTINTGGPYYEDGIGLLVTDPNTKILDAVEQVSTGGKKMPYMMRAHLATPLGEVNLLGIRGAYLSGKGTWLSTGAAERTAQYQTAADAVKDRDGISFIGGDMNSFIRTHDPIFTRNGFRRLSGNQITWPDREGLRLTTLDSRIMAAPFSLTHRGLPLDAIYGNGSSESVGSSVDATGISDHMLVKIRAVRASK